MATNPAAGWNSASRKAAKNYNKMKRICEDVTLESYSEFGVDDHDYKGFPRGLRMIMDQSVQTRVFHCYMQNQVSLQFSCK